MKWFLIVSIVALSVACGGKQKTADTTPTEKSAKQEPADLDAVTSAELANSPCGNPDWSKLPGVSENDENENEPGGSK